jgi:hypothetical protein
MKFITNVFEDIIGSSLYFFEFFCWLSYRAELEELLKKEKDLSEWSRSEVIWSSEETSRRWKVQNQTYPFSQHFLFVFFFGVEAKPEKKVWLKIKSQKIAQKPKILKTLMK